jgi:hypothetical protein
MDDWIYCTLYIHTFRDYRRYSAIAILHTVQFTVAHALWFSVLTSCILATDVSQSRCNFRSHMKSSWHNRIPFLPFILNHLLLSSSELDTIPSRLLHFTTTVLYSYHTASRLIQSQSYFTTGGLPPISCLGVKLLETHD